MLQLVNFKKLILLKNNFKRIKDIVFGINDTNEWNKLIIIYNIILFFNHIYLFCIIIDNIRCNSKSNYLNEFINIYVIFFILCNIRTSYIYLIFNIYRIDKVCATNFYMNTKDYFI